MQYRLALFNIEGRKMTAQDVLEIKGKVSTALCYAKVVEEEAVEQIRRMCDYEFTQGSRIRIMPDVHAGKGCTIGTTMTIADKGSAKHCRRGYWLRHVHREARQGGD